jgi:hypothetical protein
MRLDQASHNEDSQATLCVWDKIVFDESHKLAAI